MSLWWQGLRQDVGPKFVKFLIVKIPLTGISMLSLWAIRQRFAGAFWAPWINSLATQGVEFTLMRNQVFRSGGEIRRQLILYWLWATLMATIEGWSMSHLEPYHLGFALTYFIGHIPSALLRFYGDHKFIFPKAKTPHSH